MPVCVQSAAECVNEHCSRSEYRVDIPARFVHHTPTSSPRTCVLFSCYRLQVHVMLLTSIKDDISMDCNARAEQAFEGIASAWYESAKRPKNEEVADQRAWSKF